MTYADTFNLRDKSVVKMNDVANAADGLLVAYGQSGSTASVSLTSGSYTDYTGLSVTVTLNTGEMAFAIATVSVSAATGNDQITIRIARDGTGIGTEQALTGFRSNTSGNDLVGTVMVMDATSSGSHTYKLQWVNSTSGARTIYSIRARLEVIVFQNT
jgi:hypothetical protein